MKFRTGYKRHSGRRELNPMLRTAKVTAKPGLVISLKQFAPAIFDQGPTGSCTGHARARGVAIARAAAVAKNPAATPLPWVPSPLEFYRLARLLTNPGAPLTDDGADPIMTIRAAATWGMRAMQAPTSDGRYSDCTSENVNVMPDLSTLILDESTKGQQDFAIAPGDTASKVAAVVGVFQGGYPVTIDVPGGSDAWQNYTGGILKDEGAELDHYVCLTEVGYDENGVFYAKGDNSWGDSWGQNGSFQIDVSVIGAAQDLIVCVEAT